MTTLEQRVQIYSRELIEESAHWKIFIDLLCLVYAFAVQPIIEAKFVCNGCLTNENNHLGYSCCVLSSQDILDIHFEGP